MTTFTWGGLTVDTNLLSGYGYRDSFTVSGTVYPRYLGYIAAGITEIGNRVSSATALLAGASGSSLTIATGTLSLVADVGKGWAAGMIVTITYDASHYMVGTVTSYDPNTGAMTVTVLDTAGTGTYASWTVVISGRQGQQGPIGNTGATGPAGSGSTINVGVSGTTVTAAPRALVNLQQSLTAVDNAGASRADVNLVGDTASPGAAKRYATDGSGTRGWQTTLLETRVAMAANNIDCAAGAYFTKTISGATTLTVSNVPAAGIGVAIVLELTNGGAATVTWWNGVRWPSGQAPVLSVSGVDVLGFYTIDGGTNWRGFTLGKAMA